MELSFSELRAKEVVNTQDGKKLGKVCDVVLCYPENKWLGIVVPGSRGFGKRNDLFIDLRNIVKSGEDVVLVCVGVPRKQNGGKRVHGSPVSPPPPPQGKGFDGFNEEKFGRNFEEFE